MLIYVQLHRMGGLNVAVKGKLIIEIYEISSIKVPRYEFTPCELSRCFRRSQKAALSDILKSGYAELGKRNANIEKQRQQLRLLEDSGFDRIEIEYIPEDEDGFDEPSVILQNVRPVDMNYADARRRRGGENEIILMGQYRVTRGGSTTLKDAQRVTLEYTPESETYSTEQGADSPSDEAFFRPDSDSQHTSSPAGPENSFRTIRLQITYLVA